MWRAAALAALMISKPPAVFVSSSIVERGFCASCGTPLTYRRIASENVSVTLFSLDDPAAVSPDTAFSPETQVPWCLTLGDLPAARMARTTAASTATSNRAGRSP